MVQSIKVQSVSFLLIHKTADLQRVLLGGLERIHLFYI